MSEIKERFDAVSRQYDAQRRKLIPCFDDFYGVCVAAASVDKFHPRILDVGAGTGLLTSFLIGRYPDASYTLIDFSDKMLDVARERFGDDLRIRYLVGDYAGCDFAGDYDIIASALSIHHLPDADKRTFYRKCFGMLNPGGIFINADQVRGETSYIEDLNKSMWRRYVESGGLSPEEIEACYRRVRLDKEAGLAEQLGWLGEAGFCDVACLYKYFHFAVLFGRKRG